MILLGFVSTEDDVVMDENERRGKLTVFAKPCGFVDCSAPKENHKYMHMCTTH